MRVPLSNNTAAGYVLLLAWMRSFGRLFAVDIEGTGAYGTGLSRT
ncbi:hypothetical protein LAUMK13_05470 [Mycobacterium innocens]|uniref:Uncharacterized protein n=1 Tax=Mycobacterium innocens TaxID=2341083 RepID=A0A498QKB8_9MYCO|nr:MULTISPECIES: hypothetical protein [Mycobacterium]VBA45460.1 hypothetical protein LAUMK13_05470 [Mycobacterium innocens]